MRRPGFFCKSLFQSSFLLCNSVGSDHDSKNMDTTRKHAYDQRTPIAFDNDITLDLKLSTLFDFKNDNVLYSVFTLVGVKYCILCLP